MSMAEVFRSLNLKQNFEIKNRAHLNSCYSVSHLAASSIGAVGCAIAELLNSTGVGESPPKVTVDQTLASHWFGQSIRPIGWSMPPIWDSVAGDYQTQDGWIKLHTNLDHHKAAALSVLGCEAVRERVGQAVRTWSGNELEARVVEAGGVAAIMRSRDEWLAHPQGIAVRQEPLVSWGASRKQQLREWRGSASRPLEGLRVLDLTRVLAGPVCTRTLAGFGAEVLRIDPPMWDEPNVVPDISLGKRCARLNLKSKSDRDVFEALLASADMLIHGYRSDALAGLGYTAEVRQQISPNLIEVALDAYGWTGPWSNRRGFDSLVQMSCGIAHQGMRWAKTDRPTPLPVQALDHATGYFMAAAAINALSVALERNELRNARLSLARTAELLVSEPQVGEITAVSNQLLAKSFSDCEEQTPWGPALRLKPALVVEGAPMKWDLPSATLGSSRPEWRSSASLS